MSGRDVGVERILVAPLLDDREVIAAHRVLKHVEAQSRDGQPIVIDAKLDDIGSYNRTLTGTWKQAGVGHPFKMARE